MRALHGIVLSSLTLLAPICSDAKTGSYQVIENKTSISLANPSLSQRKIEKIQLKNGLKAYIISDPKAEKSAAALSVGVGSWQDPKEYPGMAHFLEHMLFMGTKAYPKESEYMSYIGDHGGIVNAYTATDRTVYIFSVNNSAFEGAFDRFSHFFIDPLFSTKSINKELHAVDQEHSKNVENDGWRSYMILKETGNPDHPNVGFSTGNAKTLSGIPQDALRKWYEKYYSANRMNLVVVSPLPLEDLIKLTVESFSNVPNSPNTIDPVNQTLFSNAQTGHITYVKPVKDLREISIQWELPKAFSSLQAKKYANLLAYVLGNEAPNSLSSTLKKEKLIENLSTGVPSLGKEHSIFEISMDLTTLGVSQIPNILHQCFQVIAKLKASGIPSNLFEEIHMLSRISYEYQSRQVPFEYVSEYAHRLVEEDFSTFPEEQVLPSTYDPQKTQAFLSLLTPETSRIVVLANPKTTGIPLDKKEKWMNAEYAIKEIPKSILDTCQNASPHALVELPQPNPFVPSSLSLVTENEKQTTPILLANNAGEKIYYLADHSYKLPQSFLNFKIQTPLLSPNAKSYVLTDLYLLALQEKLSSTLFLAGIAGLSPHFSHGDCHIQIGLTGFSEKAPLLMHQIFSSLSQVTPTKEEFEIYLQKITSQYENGQKELPIRQAAELLSDVLYNTTVTNKAKSEEVQTITYEDFLAFSKELLRSTYVEGLFYGNLTANEATQLWSSLKAELNSEPYLASLHTKKKVLLLPEKHGPYRINQTTSMQGNGIILAIEEGSYSFEKRAAQQILGLALKDDFFDTLRTKQQTGYIAQAWDMEVERELLQFFGVQSSTHEPAELLARFELFLEDFIRHFEEKISKERFENMKAMLVQTLETPPENIQQMGQLLFELGFNFGDFNWIEKRIQAVKELSYESLFAFAKANLSRSNHRRLAVLMQGISSEENPFHYETVADGDMKEIGTYISWKE